MTLYPNSKNSDLSKLKGFTDDNFLFSNGEICLLYGRKHWEKEQMLVTILFSS